MSDSSHNFSKEFFYILTHYDDLRMMQLVVDEDDYMVSLTPWNNFKSDYDILLSAQ